MKRMEGKGGRIKSHAAAAEIVRAFLSLILHPRSFKPMASLRLNLWQHGIFVLVLCLVSLPLGSFSTARLPGDFSLDTMGLVNYIKVYSDPATYELFTNTFIYVGGSVFLGITMAVALAWLVERTDMPGKIWIYAGVPMTLAVPGMLQAMAWVILL